MRRLLSISAVLVAALCLTAVALADVPPDDGQNPPEPVPGSVAQTPPDPSSVPQGTIWCGITQYNPWHRYYSPWNIWFIQARTLAMCKVSSGSIWLPYNAYQINIRSRLYRAFEFLAYNLIDDRFEFTVNDSIKSVRNAHECEGKVRNTKYQLRSTVDIDLDGVQEEDPWEYQWDTFGGEFTYTCG